jgi:hypothetical protein
LQFRGEDRVDIQVARVPGEGGGYPVDVLFVDLARSAGRGATGEWHARRRKRGNETNETVGSVRLVVARAHRR